MHNDIHPDLLHRLSQLKRFSPLLTTDSDYGLQQKGLVTIKEDSIGGAVFVSTGITEMGNQYAEGLNASYIKGQL